jgi:hypothetical protein
MVPKRASLVRHRKVILKGVARGNRALVDKRHTDMYMSIGSRRTDINVPIGIVAAFLEESVPVLELP